MAYTLDIDPDVQERIRALPPEALVALGEAFEVLSLVPERGSPLNPDNPDGGLFHLTFGLWGANSRPHGLNCAYAVVGPSSLIRSSRMVRRRVDVWTGGL